MLHLLRKRCHALALNSKLRLQTYREDALSYLARPAGDDYDLVATHFFLDCLTQTEVDALAAALATKLAPEARWLISDFRIPQGPMRLPARALVGFLYLAFRILTGLRTNRLPDHAAALTRRGFTRTDHHSSLFGILTTELWTTGTDATR